MSCSGEGECRDCGNVDEVVEHETRQVDLGGFTFACSLCGLIEGGRVICPRY